MSRLWARLMRACLIGLGAVIIVCGGYVVSCSLDALYRQGRFLQKWSISVPECDLLMLLLACGILGIVNGGLIICRICFIRQSIRKQVAWTMMMLGLVTGIGGLLYLIIKI